jgi:hypothetical protein
MTPETISVSPNVITTTDRPTYSIFHQTLLRTQPQIYTVHLVLLCLFPPSETRRRSIENLTIDELVCFFAEQGVTEEEADDMFEYAYQWLTTATTERASQLTEIQSLLDEVNLAIHKAGNRPP